MPKTKRLRIFESRYAGAAVKVQSSSFREPAWRFHRRVLLAGASAVVIVLAANQGANASKLGVASQNTSATTNAAAAAITSAQQAAALTQQSMQSLTRATQALQAMQAVQNAARSAALGASSNVPNGLGAGGMQVAPGVGTDPSLWQNADLPTQTSSNGQTTVTIQQTAQKAILTWSSFNVGQNTIAYFNQSAGTATDGSNGWVALNRVTDPTGVPSQILGQIRAEGSVYLINRNGIIFGGSSQVNVSTFVASSLNLFSNDLATSNNRFLTGGIGDLNTTNFATNSILLTSSTPGAGDVTIAPGAAITVGTQGLALIAAPDVRNGGVITAPGGQVALIAGIGVSYDYNKSSFTPGNSSIPQGTNDNATTNLRFANYGKLTDAGGNDITPVGTLVNDGMIFTPRGNITLLGGAIEQNGVAIATTSVAQPGSIVIESLYEVGVNPGSQSPADEFDAKFYTGSIAFGPQAVTSILADSNGVTLSSDATSLAPFQNLPKQASFTTPLPTQGPGLIEVIGQAIDFKGGTLVYAPGQTLSASTAVLKDPRTSVPPVDGSGRILLESGAILDVSGIPGTVLTVDSNLLTVKLAGNELADSPLQQNGFLFGSTVTVDMGNSGINPETGQPWVGTPLANLASFANLVQRSISQLLVNGGSIFLSANEMVGAPGSVINLTGGYTDFLGGMIHTTVLLGADGRRYGVGNADPNMTYVGIAGQFTVDHAHWGLKDVYSSPLINAGYFQPEYIQGGNAGMLTVLVSGSNGVSGGAAIANSGAAILQSTILATAFAGQRQVAGGALPSNGTFSFTGILPIEIGDPGTMSAPSLAASSVPANFAPDTPLLATPGSIYDINIFNSQALSDAGFKSISLSAVGGTGQSPQPIVQDAGAKLSVQPGGSIALTGSSITVNGNLTARGGAIDITSIPNNPGLASNAPGGILVGAGAVLDVSGFFINEQLLLLDQQTPALPINGGSIALIADAGNSEGNNGSGTLPSGTAVDLTGNITLAAGSLLDLHGGGHVRNGQLQLGSNGVPLGSGGNLTIETYAGQQSPLNSAAPLPARGILTLDGTIDALGFGGGGTLTLQQTAFQIGGDAATTPSHAFYFDPGHWGDLGFGSFNLTSLLGSRVPDGAVVRLQHRNLLPDLARIVGAPEGANPGDYAVPGLLTGTQRTPTNFSVTAGLEQQQNPGQISTGGGNDAAEVGRSAQILGDPGAAVSISSYGLTTVLGTISAPGGSISLSVTSRGIGLSGPLYLGPSSMLDVSGTPLVDPLATPVSTSAGLVTPFTGRILAGGTVSLSDDWAPILVAPGATINVSGASGAFDVAHLVPGGRFGGGQVVLDREPVWSDAGRVNIAGMLFEGTLIGKPGAPQAAGGTLSITGDTSSSGTSLILVQDTAQALKDAGAAFNFATFVPTLQPVGPFLQPVDPKISQGNMLFGANTLNGSGFDNLILTSSNGAVGFAGQVVLTLNNSIVINAAGITASNRGNYNLGSPLPGGLTNRASLTATAPYIAINGISSAANSLPTLVLRQSADAALTLNAGQIDLSAFISLANIGQATFNSRGDIRLLPAQFIPSGSSLLGYLLTAGDLTFNAADIYPATDTAFVIQAAPFAGSTAPTTITFGYPEGVAPSTTAPLSAGGTLLVSATNIIQNGQIQAPFGSIILGTSSSNTIANAVGTFFAQPANTQSVILGSGSITSVSANGMVIPFGNTVDQTSWMYNPHTNNPTWNGYTDQSVFATPLTQAPQGVITLSGSNVAFNSGAVVNISGGGDLKAQEWIPGTGGSRDVLSQSNTSFANSVQGTQVPLYPDGRQIYAIVPSFGGKVAPYDATMSQSGMTPGQQVYLAGGPGLPAGFYTLLPAKYATLPGAFRVVVNSGVTNPLSNQTFTLPDGTMEMTGYLGNGFTGSRDASISQFFVQSASVWGRYSQYVTTSANSFFPAYAALHNQAIPYVPNDAGRLLLAATTDLTLGGTLLGSPAAGGTGAQVDVSAQYLDVTNNGSGTTVVTGVLNFNGPNASNGVYSGMTVSLTAPVSSDVFTVTGTGTLVVPTGQTVIRIGSDGSRTTLSAGTYAVTSGQQFTGLSAGGASGAVTFTATTADTIAYSSSNAAASATLQTSLTYLEVSAEGLDALGVTSLLIGGTRTQTSAGTVITPTANSIQVANDGTSPLTAPEILLVAAPQFQSTTIQIDTEGDVATIKTPVANTGLVTIRSGGVVQAVGAAGATPPTKLILGSALKTLPTLPNSVVSSASSTTANSIANYYIALDAALGTVLQVSNGAADTVQLPSQAQISPGPITVTDNVNPANPAFTLMLPSLSGATSGTGAIIQSRAQILGGNSLTIASTGDSRVEAGASLSATHFSAISSNITFVGSGVAPVSGLVIDAGALASLESSKTVDLQSYGAIAFQGNVNFRMNGDTQSSLTLGAGALSSDGGQVTISAPTEQRTEPDVAELCFRHRIARHRRRSAGVWRWRQDADRVRQREPGGEPGRDRAGHGQIRFRRVAGDAADADHDRRYVIQPDAYNHRGAVGGVDRRQRADVDRTRRCHHLAGRIGHRGGADPGSRRQHHFEVQRRRRRRHGRRCADRPWRGQAVRRYRAICQRRLDHARCQSGHGEHRIRRGC
jgi:filamentous hemagglutinin family protein